MLTNIYQAIRQGRTSEQPEEELDAEDDADTAAAPAAAAVTVAAPAVPKAAVLGAPVATEVLGVAAVIVTVSLMQAVVRCRNGPRRAIQKVEAARVVGDDKARDEVGVALVILLLGHQAIVVVAHGLCPRVQ